MVHANFGLTETVQRAEGTVSFRQAPKRFPARPHARKLSEFIKHDALLKNLLVKSGYRSGDHASVGVPVCTVRFNSVTGEAWAA